MSLRVTGIAIFSLFSSSNFAHATEQLTISSCTFSALSGRSLNPYGETFILADSYETGPVAAAIFESFVPEKEGGRLHKDRFGTVQFEERIRGKKGESRNEHQTLYIEDYCVKSSDGKFACQSYCKYLDTQEWPGD